MTKELETISCEKLSNMLHTFICEMENTLKDKNKRNRAYASQVFWKNKYTLEIIETELKKYEKILTEFDIYAKVLNTENKLKAFEIIKNKVVDVCWIIEMKNKTLEDYNKAHVYELTQEEYDLLKEILK